MENLQRELEKELKLIENPTPSRKSTEWTLLMVGEHGEIKRADNFTGRVRHYRIYLIIFSLLIAGLSFIYYSSYKKNAVLSLENETYKEMLSSLQKEKEGLLAKLIVYSEGKDETLFAEVPHKNNSDIKIVASTSVKKVTSNGAGLSDEYSDELPMVDMTSRDDDDAENKADFNSDDKSSSESDSETVFMDPLHELPKVNVENLKLEPNESTNFVKVQFRVINSSEDTQISGHVFGILKTENNDTGEWVIKPNGVIVNGYPDNVKVGYNFSISRYKTIILKYPDLKEFDLYKAIKIVVYSKDGNLIFDKDFPVDI